jgi:hypothetical protein
MGERVSDGWTYVLGLYGLGNVANGAWMLASPRSWYDDLPARVPDFGPLNEHFVRDIGGLFVVIGAGLMAAALWRRARVPGIAFAAAFTWMHALVHVFDTASGRVAAAHWLLDLVPVYLPAAVLAFALRSALRGARP